MKNNNDDFLIFFACSVAAHLVVIYFFFFGLPNLFKTLPEEQIISFEMLPVSSISNIKTQKVQKEKAIEAEDAKKVEKSRAAEPKVEENTKEEVKKEPLAQEEKIVEEPKKEEPKEVTKEVEVIKKKKEEPKPKKEEPKKQQAKETPKNKSADKKPPVKNKSNSDLDALLKTLEQASEGTNNKSSKYARSKQTEFDKESKGTYNEDLPISISEEGTIRQQIERHWNVPAGAQNAERVQIILYIELEINGTVRNVQLKDKVCPAVPAPVCQAIADSAVRAVWRASPIENLLPERYDSWGKFNLGFDPSRVIN